MTKLLRSVFKITGIGLLLLTLSAGIPAFGKGGNAPVTSALDNPIVIVLLVIILVLLLAITLLSFVVNGAMDVYREKMKQTRDAARATGATLLLVFCLSGFNAKAQEPDTIVKSAAFIEGISNTAFYTMISIIALEMLILLALLYNLRVLLGMERKRRLKTSEQKSFGVSFNGFWQKINRFKPAEQETDLDLGHDFDGIRELDNRLPPWWLYGFYVCILIAIVYLWRFHVSHTAPSSVQEYQYAMEAAEIEKLEYLKNSADNVDENSVVYLNDESSLAAGKNVFTSTCSACHGKDGEGGVGPNLTDLYWLHGGSINDIFKTIKYGWPEKGMRSWQDDYSARQMAQIASYVKSLQGSLPPNAKEKQGDLYKEEDVPAADTLKSPVTAVQQ